MKTSLMNDLWEAMRFLYNARYKSQGPTAPDGSCPEFDIDTFNKIASLQTDLQSLISRLESQQNEKITNNSAMEALRDQTVGVDWECALGMRE